MSVLLHIHFDFDPKTVNLNDQKSIENVFPIAGAEKLKSLPGLQFKIWGYDDHGHGSGFYLYATRRDAQIRAKLAAKTMPTFPGIYNVTTTIYEILEPHSSITMAPLDIPANESYPDGFEDTI